LDPRLSHISRTRARNDIMSHFSFKNPSELLTFSLLLYTSVCVCML
jgi:hypothetical protein